jgi:hypothetical protein
MLQPRPKLALDQFISTGYKTDPRTFSTIIQSARRLGATDDDLKPYFDKFSALGFNFDETNGTVGNVTPAQGTPGTITPRSPNTPAAPPGPTDQQQIENEATREKQQGLDVLGQQRDIRQGVLSSLGDVLGKHADAQFAYNYPDLKEGLQANGTFTSQSALANAVARERANLLAPQLSALSQYGLGANDQYASGLGTILGQQQELQQGGLQRKFSLADYEKQSQLAREIGAQMVPNTPSPFLGALSGAGQGALAAAPIWASNPALGAGLTLAGAVGGGASKGGGTFICTHLHKLGFMTKKEVKHVHKKIFSNFKHPFSLMAYWVLAPIFILESGKEYDWKTLKLRLCDDVLRCKDSEEAFSLYMNTCLEIFFKTFKKVNYGY